MRAERRLANALARPEPGDGHLVAVGLAGHRVRQVREAALMRRRPPPRDARDQEVERALEQVRRGADLSQEPGAQARHRPVDADERRVVATHRIRVPGAGPRVLRERHGARQPVRGAMDVPRSAGRRDGAGGVLKRLGDRGRGERNGVPRAAVGLHPQGHVAEIERGRDRPPASVAGPVVGPRGVKWGTAFRDWASHSARDTRDLPTIRAQVGRRAVRARRCPRDVGPAGHRVLPGTLRARAKATMRSFVVAIMGGGWWSLGESNP